MWLLRCLGHSGADAPAAAPGQGLQPEPALKQQQPAKQLLAARHWLAAGDALADSPAGSHATPLDVGPHTEQPVCPQPLQHQRSRQLEQQRTRQLDSRQGSRQLERQSTRQSQVQQESTATAAQGKSLVLDAGSLVATVSSYQPQQQTRISANGTLSLPSTTLMVNSPTIMTALSADGCMHGSRVICQTPLSVSYFGDLGSWIPTCIGQCPGICEQCFPVLRELFSLEGEGLLQEMLDAVQAAPLQLANFDGFNPQAAMQGHQASWRRVMRVPVSCSRSSPRSEHDSTQPTSGALHTSKLMERLAPQHQASHSPLLSSGLNPISNLIELSPAEQDAQQLSAQVLTAALLTSDTPIANGTEGASVADVEVQVQEELLSDNLLDTDFISSLPKQTTLRRHGSSFLGEASDPPSRALTQNSLPGSPVQGSALSNARSLHAQLSVQRSQLSSRSAANAVQAMDAMASTSTAAAAVSVAVRNAPKRMKSLLDLSLSTRSHSMRQLQTHHPLLEGTDDGKLDAGAGEESVLAMSGSFAGVPKGSKSKTGQLPIGTRRLPRRASSVLPMQQYLAAVPSAALAPAYERQGVRSNFGAVSRRGSLGPGCSDSSTAAQWADNELFASRATRDDTSTKVDGLQPQLSAQPVAENARAGAPRRAKQRSAEALVVVGALGLSQTCSLDLSREQLVTQAASEPQIVEATSAARGTLSLAPPARSASIGAQSAASSQPAPVSIAAASLHARTPSRMSLQHFNTSSNLGGSGEPSGASAFGTAASPKISGTVAGLADAVQSGTAAICAKQTQGVDAAGTGTLAHNSGNLGLGSPAASAPVQQLPPSAVPSSNLFPSVHTPGDDDTSYIGNTIVPLWQQQQRLSTSLDMTATVGLAVGTASSSLAPFSSHMSHPPAATIPMGDLVEETSVEGRSTVSAELAATFAGNGMGDEAALRAALDTDEEMESQGSSCGMSKAQAEELGYCWHDVYITLARDPSGRRLLLLYQTDVTVRTHLESTMAQLTEAQLNMLCQIFPRHFIEHLCMAHGAPPTANAHSHLARSHEDVTLLFMDIVGFTSMSKQVHPAAVMELLNDIFSVLDDLAGVHGVQKVETAGDCYIVAAGILKIDKEGFSEVHEEHDPPKTAASVFAFAKDMLSASRKVTMPHDKSPLCIRIGIHTGPCVSGIVGSKLPKFSIFGDSMNTASRMESTCTPGRIQISARTYELLLASGQSEPCEWEPTGGVEVKGKGVMETYLWRDSTLSSTTATPPKE